MAALKDSLAGSSKEIPVDANKPSMFEAYAARLNAGTLILAAKDAIVMLDDALADVAARPHRTDSHREALNAYLMDVYGPLFEAYPQLAARLSAAPTDATFRDKAMRSLNFYAFVEEDPTRTVQEIQHLFFTQVLGYSEDAITDICRNIKAAAEAPAPTK